MDSAGCIPGSTIPLSLYVHMPWCVSKCPYCDFNSHGLRGSDVPEEPYLEALLADLDVETTRAGRRPIESVFMGGGTPSLFSGSAVATLLSAIDRRLGLGDDAEITVEANPGVSERARFRAYREAGVNRVSLGVQSFNDSALARLGRIHDGDDARAAIDAARAAGFENINIDLMYALPGQTPEDSALDVEEACDRGASHVSHYQLTLEPNTLFARYPPALPDHDAAWAMLCTARDVLTGAGFDQYEVSAFATGNRRSRHNLNYWEFGDYLGIGAGAHGKVSGAGISRCWKQRQPRRYMETAGTPDMVAGERRLHSQDLVLEFMLNALRLTLGFEEHLFPARTGLPLTAAEPSLSGAEERGLIWRAGGRIGPTELGRRFLDDLTGLFVGDVDGKH